MAEEKVMIVEDDRIVARDLQNSLKNVGFDITAIVSSGPEAIERAKEDRPDLVLMDIILKGEMDGIEAAEHIRNRFNIPVVYLTALSNEKVLERVKVTEPFGYIIKPFEDRELFAIIEIALYKHKTQEALKESEEQYRNLVETSQDMIWKFDTDGCFTYVNPAWKRILGYKSDEMLGRPFTEFKPAELVESASNVFENVLKGSEIFGYETIFAAKSGEQKNLVFNMRTLKDANGNTIGTQGTAYDITERKRAEQALKESEKRYRTLFETAADAIFVRDMESGYFLDVNNVACESLGYSKKELLQMTPEDIVHPDYVSLIPEQIEDIRQRGPAIFESAQTRRDGKTMPIEVSQQIIEYGERPAVLSIIRDITERKQAEQEKIQLEKLGALGRLVGGIAHELNNPMTGMLNFIDYCLKYTAEDNKIYPILEDINRETQRCCKIVGNLLTFSRMEKEDEEAYVKENITLIFDRVFNLLSYRIEKENILLTQEYDEETPEIWMKESNMQQVFLNLIGNALDATKESKKKELRVEISPNGKFVQITITDSGCGISSENLQNIFDPFFTTKPPGQGTGLGLSVCNNIVRTHGGKITCESEVNSGAKFNVLLPINRRAKPR